MLSQESSRVLGIFPTTRFPEADPLPEQRLRQNLHEVLVTGREPTEAEALLIGLLESLNLIERAVAKQDRKSATRRAKEIAEQGIAGTAVRDTVRAVQAAVMTTMVITATVITST